MIEPSIRKLLTDPGTLNPVLGDRCYLGNAPQNERRARVVLTVLSKQYPHAHDGDAGYQTGNVQVACLAPTYQQAQELAKAVRRKLDGYEGFGVNAQVEILHLEIEDAEDIQRETFAGQGDPTYGVALGCRFIIQEDD